MRSEMVRIRRGGRATPCGGRLRTATVSLSSFVFIFFGSSPESSATASLLRFWGDGPVLVVKCARTFSWSAGLMTSKLSSSSTEPRCFGIFWHSRWRHCVWSWPLGPGVVVPMRSAPLSILLLHVLHPARFEAAYSTQYLADIFDGHAGPQGRVLIFNFLIVFKCSEGRLLTGGGAATRPRGHVRRRGSQLPAGCVLAALESMREVSPQITTAMWRAKQPLLAVGGSSTATLPLPRHHTYHRPAPSLG